MPILAKKIIFLDKNHFDLGGYVTKQNCCIWSTETCTLTLQSWCTQNESLFGADFGPSRGIIGLFFFENKQGEAVTVNADHYQEMLNEFLFTKIEEEDIDNIRFQQDGATCHTAEATLNILRPVFEDRIISRWADVVWLSRNCDLTPLDYYLWSAVKDKCYVDKPETIDTLKDNICEAIGEIQLQTIYNVLKNWTDCVGYCMDSRGCNLNEIICHY